MLGTFNKAKTALGNFVGLDPKFSIFLTGLAVSKVGDALFAFALPWVAYELTKSAVVMGSVFAFEILPILLFGAFAGVAVDRMDRKKVMVTADIVRAAAVALIPLLHYFGGLQVWMLFVVAFILSLFSLLFDLASTAIVPELAGEDLTKANAATQIINQFGDMGGPIVAGLVIAAIGGFNTLWLDALSFGGTLIALLILPKFKYQPQKSAVNVLQNIREGFQWLWKNSVIKTLAFQAMTGNFGYGMVSAVLMFYLRDKLHLSAELTGLTYTLLGVGGLLGGFAIIPLEKRFRKGQLYPMLLTTGLLGLLLMVLAPVWWAPGVGFGIVSGCNTAWVVLTTSVRQQFIPQELFGRVLSFSRILSTAAMPIGAVVGGFISQEFDPKITFLIAAICKAIEVGIASFSPMRKLD